MSRITIDNLSIHYPLFRANSRSIKSSVFSFLKNNKEPRAYYHPAITNVSFEVNPGDRLCLIGLNGAGKSTFLRAISGILPPTDGRIIIDGRVSPLLDFATGFEMEMTGFDNIIARGLFLGYTRKEIQARQMEIAEFSGLGDFLNQPVKIYSSGMFVRLAFAICTSLEPDILVVDEIVGAGDQTFAKKAEERMIRMLNRGNIVVMATHSTELALKLCNRGIWLEDGQVRMDAPIAETLNAFNSFARAV